MLAELLVDAEVEIIEQRLPGIPPERGGPVRAGWRIWRAAENVLKPEVREVDAAENCVGVDIGQRADHELAANGDGGVGVAAGWAAVPIDDRATHQAGEKI